MKRKTTILITLLVLMFSLLSFTLIGCKKIDIKVNASDTKVFMGQKNVNEAGEFYIGTKTFTGNGLETKSQIDFAKLVNVEYQYILLKSEGEASLDNGVLTIHGSDRGDDYFEVKVIGGKYPMWYHFHILDGGYNVFNYDQFAYVVTQETKSLQGPAILFSDIEMKQGNLAPLLDGRVIKTPGLNVFNSIYGNGHVINAYESVKANWADKEWGKPALDCSYAKNKIILRDFKIVGKVAEGEFSLSDLNAQGALIETSPGDYNHPTILIKNVIAENSHKNIYIRNSDVTIDGCLVQNASDSTISIETHPAGGANVTVKNTVLANSMTAGIVMWGYKDVEGVDPASYTNLKVEGFLDVYNWKNDKETKLMPDTEASSGLVNNLIAGNLKDPIYQPYFYMHDGTRYLHLAMIVLATPKLKENRAVINGKLAFESAGEKIDGTEMYIKDFPLPKGADTICKTCLLVGFKPEIERMPIKPDSKFEDNPRFYEDMYWGRQAQ